MAPVCYAVRPAVGRKVVMEELVKLVAEGRGSRRNRRVAVQTCYEYVKERFHPRCPSWGMASGKRVPGRPLSLLGLFGVSRACLVVAIVDRRLPP